MNLWKWRDPFSTFVYLNHLKEVRVYTRKLYLIQRASRIQLNMNAKSTACQELDQMLRIKMGEMQLSSRKALPIETESTNNNQVEVCAANRWSVDIGQDVNLKMS